MIIVVGGQKGGVGKSTVAINIAAELKKRTKEVLLMDADNDQQSTSKWAEERENAIQNGVNLVHLDCVVRKGNLKTVLEGFNGKYDYVVVDVPGRDSREMESALFIADIFITPFAPSMFDLDTLALVDRRVEYASMHNEKLLVGAVLNKCSTNVKVKKADLAAEVFKDFKHISLLDSKLHFREAYADAASMGYGITEWDNHKAKEEFEMFFNELGLDKLCQD